MFLKTRDLSDYTPVYPGGVYTPRNVVDENFSGVEIVGESGTVPASANSAGKYELYLDQVPLEQEGTVLTVGGQARTLIPYGQVPTAGTIAVSFETGAMEFHSSDAGGALLADYRGRGTALSGSLMVALQKELAATQGAVDGVAEDVAALPSDSFFGVEYFVDAENGDDENAGTRLSPVATINQAFTLFNATSETAVVFHFAQGHYTINEDTPTLSLTDSVGIVGQGIEETTIQFTYYDDLIYPAITIPAVHIENITIDTTDARSLSILKSPSGKTLNINGVLFSGNKGVSVESSEVGGRMNDCRVEFSGTSTCTISNISVSDTIVKLTDSAPASFVGEYISNVSLFGDSDGAVTFTASSVRSVVCDLPSGSARVLSQVLDSNTFNVDAFSWDTGQGTLGDSEPNTIGIRNNTVISRDIIASGGPGMFRVNIDDDDLKESIVFSGNNLTYSGAFEEVGNGGIVAFLQLFGEELPPAYIDGNAFTGPIIGIMHGHSNPAVDANRNTEDREIYITNNTFDLTFAAETGPEDTHSAIILRSRGIAVIKGNTFLHDTSAALQTGWNHNVIDQSTGTAGTTTTRIVGNYFEMKAGGALTGSAKRSVIRNGALSGGTSTAYISGNTVRELSTLDYTVASDGAGTVTQNVGTMVNLSGDSTYQVAPTFVGSMSVPDLIANGTIEGKNIGTTTSSFNPVVWNTNGKLEKKTNGYSGSYQFYNEKDDLVEITIENGIVVSVDEL